MKKLIFSVAFVAAMTLASCTGSADKKADAAATDTEAVANECDSDNGNKCEECKDCGKCIKKALEQIEGLKDEADAKKFVEKAQAFAEELVKSGKAQEAKEYLSKVGPAVVAKFPALQTAVDAADKVIDTAISACGAADCAKAAASDAACKASEAVDGAKAAAADAASKASDAVDKAADAAGKAASDAADAAKKLIPGK